MWRSCLADVRFALVAGLLLLSACHKESEGQAVIKQERDIAYVEALQHRPPPLVTLRALPVDTSEVTKHDMAKPPCAFGLPQSGTGQPLAYIGAQRALMNLDGDFQTFAADSGGERLGPQVFAHYVGKSQALRLKPMTPGEGTAGPMILTLTDAYDRPVYTATAKLACSTAPGADKRN